MYVETKCPDCKKVDNVHVDEAGYASWLAGTFIQDALSTLPPSQREQLMTGICHDCFEAMFPPEPGECCGMCLTAASVGVTTHWRNGPMPNNVGHMIAYAYPGCPAHDPESLASKDS